MKITAARARAFTLPTEKPETDGTFLWTSTTMILVELEAGGETSLGYSYAHGSVAALANDLLERVVLGGDPFQIPALWGSLVHATRNLGRNGAGAMAVSAIDVALWDLKAKLLGVPLTTLLGRVRNEVPVYGSGGFTNETVPELLAQLGGWVRNGIPRVKMKIGKSPAEDLARAQEVRRSLGEEVELFVDANEAYDVRTSLGLAEKLGDLGVTWFEQPVLNSDVAGMKFLRSRFPAGLRLTTGEYFSILSDFEQFLTAGAADVLQPDATRCQGVTGFLKASALCEAFNIPVSSHCAPSLHVALGCAVPNFLHLEYFADHVRFEQLFFEGALKPSNGNLRPSEQRPGLGLELRRADAEKFAA
jgi:L-alanine-DL-glutamate epimerase-like enolase superfamily enzyme